VHLREQVSTGWSSVLLRTYSVGLDGCMLVWQLRSIANTSSSSSDKPGDLWLAPRCDSMPNASPASSGHSARSTVDRAASSRWARARISSAAGHPDAWDGGGSPSGRNPALLLPESLSVRIRGGGPLRDVVVGRGWVAVCCNSGKWAVYSLPPSMGGSLLDG
jgi:hypothetical protein